MNEKKLQEYISKGMRYPAINSLIKKAGNKYALVLATAKRAREITDGDDALLSIDVENAVSVATAEISENLVHICKDGAKIQQTASDQEEAQETIEAADAVAAEDKPNQIGDMILDDIILD